MKTERKFITTIIFVLTILNAIAQKPEVTIPVSDSLLQNAELLPVKMSGGGWNVMAWNKIRIGNYRVVNAKGGTTNNSGKGNFWGTKQVNKKSQKFSFIFTNGSDSVFTQAKREAMLREKNPLTINTKNTEIAIGEGAVMESYDSAWITIASAEGKQWQFDFSFDNKSGSLTDGNQVITVEPAYYHLAITGDNFPARGFRFVADGSPVAAMQLNGHGTAGIKDRFVMFLNGLPQEKKLVIGAAMAALYQFISGAGVD